MRLSSDSLINLNKYPRIKWYRLICCSHSSSYDDYSFFFNKIVVTVIYHYYLVYFFVYMSALFCQYISHAPSLLVIISILQQHRFSFLNNV